MSKKFKGFSLAELLISLLVISIVLSAAIPTITKRTAQDREQIWKWSTDNNSTYFGLGANQSVLIGTPTNPFNDEANTKSIENIMDDGYTNSDSIYFNAPRFTSTGDKLAILKRSLQGHTTNMANSHISFYNIQNGIDRNTDNITYGGRIAADEHNLAFGRATLLHMENITDDYYGENTAIGHYALMATTSGAQNVAVGEKALSHNKDGSHNTALGFLAGNKVGRVAREESRTVNGLTVIESQAGYSATASENTAIGDSALSKNETGFANTALGSQSLTGQIYGDDNTSVGYYSLGTMRSGFGNTSLGANACGIFQEGNYNICIGNSAYSERTHDNYSLSIGSSPSPTYANKDNSSAYTGDIQHSVPLITGHTQRLGATKTSETTVTDNNNGIFDKELIVNAKRVAFKPFNGGDYPAFIFTSVPGDINSPNQTGYGDGVNSGISGKVFFNLRYQPGDSTKYDSVSMQIHAADEQAIIGTFNPNRIGKQGNNTKAAAYKDLSFNQVLRFDMPFKYTKNPLHNALNMLDTSNIIDPSAAGLIRSGKYKVGILGEFVDRESAKATLNYNDTFELLLNSKVNISRVAAHVINIDEMGTQIIGTDPTKGFEIVTNANPSELEHKPDFQIAYGTTKLRIPEYGVQLYEDNADSSTIQLDRNGITLQSGKDILIKDLSYQSGSVSSSITELDSRVTQIENLAQQYSDSRLKNISGDNTAGLAEINKLEVKNYTYKKDEKKTPHVGVIAQQLQKIFPNAVTKDKDGYLMIRTEDIFYAMVNSIKELCAKLQDLTAKITGLDKRITELEAQNKLLLEQNKAFEKRLEKLEKETAK